MEALIGPAIVAAAIAALVSVAGWFVSAGLSIRAEQRRREEKARDFRIALRAEIRSELADLERFDLNDDLARVERAYRETDDYRVFVPTSVRQAVVEVIVPEMFILPEEVIDPVVLYLRQRQAVESLAADIRTFDVKRYGRKNELGLYRDLNVLRLRLAEAAEQALDALEETL